MSYMNTRRTEWKEMSKFSILKDKAQFGSDNLKKADEVCYKQKLLNVVHVVEE